MRRVVMTRDEWQAWGDRFGWDVSSAYDDGAEFRVPNPDEEQGYEYVSISERVRADIDRVMEA
jgi:hypothetical protein